MRPPTVCTGCGRKFSAPKYRRSHLSQTTDPRCQSERQAFLARHIQNYLPPLSPQRSVPLPDLKGSNLDRTPTHHNNSGRDLSDDSELILDADSTRDLSDGDEHDLSDGDEPDLSNGDEPDLSDGTERDPSDGSDQDLGIESDDEDTSGDDDDEHGRFLSAEEATGLQRETWGDAHIEVYPGKRAGAIHSEGIPTMKEFENTLGGPSPNLFAPFNSQTDWELAKWAKLRGPGSTAFTELMGITDVRLSSVSPVPY